MTSGMMFNQSNRNFANFPLNDKERAAHKLGLQSWFRQFQPSFSPDPMVVPEFEKGDIFGAPFPLKYGRFGQNVRGPLARFTPGHPSFESWRFGGVTPKPPTAAFYHDTIFGKVNPFEYGNLWESNQAYNNRMFPPNPRT